MNFSNISNFSAAKGEFNDEGMRGQMPPLHFCAMFSICELVFFSPTDLRFTQVCLAKFGPDIVSRGYEVKPRQAVFFQRLFVWFIQVAIAGDGVEPRARSERTTATALRQRSPTGALSDRFLERAKGSTGHIRGSAGGNPKKTIMSGTKVRRRLLFLVPRHHPPQCPPEGAA